MGPSVKTVDQTNRATPLAEDYLKILKGAIAEGAFGTGVGPLQQQSGKAAQQFLTGLQNRRDVNTAGQVGDYTDKLIGAETTLSNRQTNRGAADMREAFGAAGTRYGTSLAKGEGMYRADSNQNLDAIIANILTAQGDRQQSARQFDVGANQNQNAQLGQAIQMLFGMGEANTAPYESVTMRGIMDPNQIVSPGWGKQLLDAGTTLGAAYLTSGGSLFGKGGTPSAPSSYTLPKSAYPTPNQPMTATDPSMFLPPWLTFNPQMNQPGPSQVYAGR